MARIRYKIGSPNGKPDNFIMFSPTEASDATGKLAVDLLVAAFTTPHAVLRPVEQLVERAISAAEMMFDRQREKGWIIQIPAVWEAEVGEEGPKDVG